MNKLLGLLLREGLGVAAGKQIKKSIDRLGGLIVYYGVVGVFALAALAFLYVLIYDWLAQLLDPIRAAAILFGANLLVALVMVLARRFAKPKPRPASLPVMAGGASGPALQAGMALGLEMRERLRRATPQLVIGAAIFGLVVGVRPQLIGLGRKRALPAPEPKSRKRR